MAEKTPPAPPQVAVRDRRILARLANPMGEPSAPIQFKDPRLIGRWFNRQILSDQIWRAKNKGWDLVYEKDLVDLEQVGGYGLDPAGGHITRGERHTEVLMCMDKGSYQEIQLAKAKWNNRTIGNPIATRKEVIEAAGKQLGDEAAEFLSKKTRASMQVTDTKEIIRVEPES